MVSKQVRLGSSSSCPYSSWDNLKVIPLHNHRNSNIPASFLFHAASSVCHHFYLPVVLYAFLVESSRHPYSYLSHRHLDTRPCLRAI